MLSIVGYQFQIQQHRRKKMQSTSRKRSVTRLCVTRKVEIDIKKLLKKFQGFVNSRKLGEVIAILETMHGGLEKLIAECEGNKKKDSSSLPSAPTPEPVFAPDTDYEPECVGSPPPAPPDLLDTSIESKASSASSSSSIDEDKELFKTHLESISSLEKSYIRELDRKLQRDERKKLYDALENLIDYFKHETIEEIYNSLETVDPTFTECLADVVPKKKSRDE